VERPHEIKVFFTLHYQGFCSSLEHFWVKMAYDIFFLSKIFFIDKFSDFYYQKYRCQPGLYP